VHLVLKSAALLGVQVRVYRIDANQDFGGEVGRRIIGTEHQATV
jgi:hypothetical protein